VAAMEEEDAPQAPVVEKKSRRIVWILVAVVFVVGAAATGVILGPKLLGGGAAAAKKKAEHVEPEKAPETSMFDPIVVDVRTGNGELHHLKIGLSMELPEGVKEEDVKRVKPRGRHAAIAFLRAKGFDELTQPERFAELSQDLNDEIVEAMGKDRVRRILITDYVAQ
jgi:flagellar basal body-associated protein FliL